MAPKKHGTILRFCLTLFMVQVLFLTGCGSEKPTLPETKQSSSKDRSQKEIISIKDKNESATKDPEPTDEEIESSQTTLPVNKLTEATHIDKRDRIWIKNKPYDVWFENPLKTLGDIKLLSLNPKVTRVSATSNKNNTSPDLDTLPNADNNINQSDNILGPLWDKLITKEMIQNEVKSIRNRLNGSFRSVGQFNKSLEQIELDCTMLASLSHLVESKKINVTWKQSTSKMIHLSVKIGESAAKRGRNNHKTGNSYLQKLSNLLGGNQSAVGDLPEKKIELSDIADRTSIMQQMEKINQLIETEINSQKKFEANRLRLIQETTLLAILANTILNKSYESANEEEYQSAATLMLKEALELSNSAHENQYSKWTDLSNRIRKRCDQCHSEYRL